MAPNGQPAGTSSARAVSAAQTSYTERKLHCLLFLFFFFYDPRCRPKYAEVLCEQPPQSKGSPNRLSVKQTENRCMIACGKSGPAPQGGPLIYFIATIYHHAKSKVRGPWWHSIPFHRAPSNPAAAHAPHPCPTPRASDLSRSARTRPCSLYYSPQASKK